MIKAYKEFVLHDNGLAVVAGVDEVGRGAWAGPLVAAAVVIMDKRKIVLPLAVQRLVKDSKKLLKTRRAEIAKMIKDKAVAWAVAEVTVEEIDNLGIGQANKQAVKQALDKLGIVVDYYLADYVAGFCHPTLPGEIIKQGDNKVLSIASASIVAKVWRDDLMKRLDKAFPGYGFSNHVGYGTKEHRVALRTLGISPIHRKSFQPIKELLE